MMYFSYQFSEISEFERIALKKQFLEELTQVEEIRAIIEEAFTDLAHSKKLYDQQAKAIRLETAIRDKIKLLELDRQMKMLTLSLSDLKKVRKALRKRMIYKIDPRAILTQLSLLEEKVEDEIYRREWGLKEGFHSFPVSGPEVDILLETIAI